LPPSVCHMLMWLVICCHCVCICACAHGFPPPPSPIFTMCHSHVSSDCMSTCCLCQGLSRRIKEGNKWHKSCPEQIQGNSGDWLKGPLEVANCTVEPGLKTSYQEWLYTTRTLVQDQQEVTVRIMNNIDRD
jgi:hypothetical protein